MRGKLSPKSSFMTQVESSSTRESNGVMTVLAFVSCNHNRWIFRRAFYPFLHGAFAVGAPIITPGKWTIFDSLLSIFPPTVAIFKMIHFAFGHECKSWLPDSLLPLLFYLIPPTKYFTESQAVSLAALRSSSKTMKDWRQAEQERQGSVDCRWRFRQNRRCHRWRSGRSREIGKAELHRSRNSIRIQ